MIVPPLSALLAHAAIQMLGDQCPLLGPISHDKLEHAPVFLGRPRPLHIERLAFSSDLFLEEEGRGAIRQISLAINAVLAATLDLLPVDHYIDYILKPVPPVYKLMVVMLIVLYKSRRRCTAFRPSFNIRVISLVVVAEELLLLL